MTSTPILFTRADGTQKILRAKHKDSAIKFLEVMRQLEELGPELEKLEREVDSYLAESPGDLEHED